MFLVDVNAEQAPPQPSPSAQSQPWPVSPELDPLNASIEKHTRNQKYNDLACGLRLSRLLVDQVHSKISLYLN